MEPKLKEFCAKLKQGSAFLFLGQNYLRLETGRDPFLAEVLRKYGLKNGEKANYHEILASGAALSGEPALMWMDERCRHLPVPEWLKTVAGYPWSGIYTSAIDSLWSASFRTSWRDIEPLFEEKYKPSDPRNRCVLHCTFLFGCINRVEEGERPPLNGFEWRKRKQVAVALARRLPEVLTPLGLLAIEGYAGEADWLSPNDLLPILDDLNPGQTHIFSITQELLNHPDVRQLMEHGKLILHHESLEAALLQGEETGLLRLGRPPEEEVSGRHIQIEDKSLTVPRDIWNQVSRSAIILDDTVLVPPSSLSEATRYREFRNFLAVSDGKPQWTAYARGFAFPRHFEKRLRQEVGRRLGMKSLRDEPVILHGQTGTGKTVALGALAYAIRREHKYPVLFIERKTQRPIASDVDRFCQWAEDSGAPACLIVWDGMLEPEEFARFLRYLTSRGRKVVLVGSCYRIPDEYQTTSRFIQAPARLLSEEVTEFATFLKTFHPSFEHILPASLTPPDETFLAALYRLLPATRPSIRTGVSKEVSYAEQELVRRARQTPSNWLPETTLAQALLKVGILPQEEFLSSQAKEIAGETVSDIQDLTGLVMLPGRFGLSVPLELLLRALGKNGFSNIVHLFKDIDIFRWFEDSVGNIEVGPRNTLEARLIVQARLGGAKTEAAFAQRLLLEVENSTDSFSDGRQTSFAVDLVRSLGPQGQAKTYFAPYFKDLSVTLRRLREERGVEIPRLMLQEANLLREWAIEQSQHGVSELGSVDEAFNEGERVIRQALDLVGDDQRNRELRGALLGELATTFGSRFQYALGQGKPLQEAIEFFKEAREAVYEARMQSPESYYPVDVLAWTTRELLKAEVLDQKDQAESKADLLHAFHTTELNELGYVQQEQFNKRRLELAPYLNMEEMAEEAFTALVAQGSGAGYYLRAFGLSQLPDTAQNLTDDSNLGHLRHALLYLEDHWQGIAHDSRCLDLLLNLWWMVHTRTRFFERERVPLPLSAEQWRRCLEIILALEATGRSPRAMLLVFLRGLTLFHLGDVQHAFEIFRDVERESDQVRSRWRIIRSYLASTSKGQPRKFHGTVAWVSANGAKGELYVEELRHNILFLPRDFGRSDIRHGETLGEFHIAFNFLGPIADPVSHRL